MFQNLCARTAVALGSKLDFESVEHVGKVLGDVLWYAAPARRRMAVTAAVRHLGLERPEARIIVRNSFRNTCISVLEIFISDKVGQHFLRDQVEMVEGDAWRALQENREPAVCITGHMGSWELLSGLLHPDIHHARKQVVVRTHRKPAFNKAMLELRSKPDVEIIDHRRASSAVLGGLRENGAAAFLVDHNTMRREAVFLPFLGELAAVNRGPALLAVRARAKVWPMCLLRKGGGRYALYSKDPLDTTQLSGTIHDRVLATADYYTRAIEEWVRRFPDQWMWIHKRWKTRPPAERTPRS